MKLRLLLAGIALLSGPALAQTSSADIPPAASAAAGRSSPAKDHGAAAERCEAAVAETIRTMRGQDAEDVQFTAAKRVLTPMSGDDTGVKGEGRYQGTAGAMPFTYSCAYNATSGATSGVVFRETGKRTAAAAPKLREADIHHISTEACETATAAALKQKYPRVGRIAFGSDSRRLRPTAEHRASLEGQGGVQRAPGMSSIPFSYRCEFETPSGKLVAVQTTE